MSEPTPSRRRRPPYVESEEITDPAEHARMRELSLKHRQTALYKIGPDIGDAPPDLLAQYIVEMEADERQAFLNELVQRLPEDVLRPLGEALQKRLERGAA
jgi:hypothetical protein